MVSPYVYVGIGYYTDDMAINDVCYILEVKKSKLLTGGGSNRPKKEAYAIKVLSYWLRKNRSYSFTKIGKILDRGHSAIVIANNWMIEREEIIEVFPEINKALKLLNKASEERNSVLNNIKYG